jgi:NADH-quinone oxidoreductase subunit L
VISSSKVPVGFVFSEDQEMSVFAVLLVPLLPLLAAFVVAVGPDDTRALRTKIAAYPIGAAFCSAIAILYFVATQGPITLRFYDPASVGSFAFPIGFYVDRLSAVMMVLISSVGTVIYTYSIGYITAVQDQAKAKRAWGLFC